MCKKGNNVSCYKLINIRIINLGRCTINLSEILTYVFDAKIVKPHLEMFNFFQRGVRDPNFAEDFNSISKAR